MHERPNLYYPIVNPNTMEEVWPKETAVWKYSKDITEKYINEKRLYWGIDGLAKIPACKIISFRNG
jgi:adenine-specific DNA-methyltransferase